MIILTDVIFIFLLSFFLAILLSNKYPPRKTFLVLFASIFLHEFAHKAVASYFGYVSMIKAEISLTYLIMTIVMYIFTGLLVPPPVYTLIFAKITPHGLSYYIMEYITPQNALPIALIAIAGPIINLILAIVAHLILSLKLYDTEFEKELFILMRNFNIMLFVINAFPIIPGNDGSIFLEAIKKVI